MFLLLVVIALLAPSALSNVVSRGPLPCSFPRAEWREPFESFTMENGLFQYWCDGRTGDAKALGCVVNDAFVPINNSAYIGKEVVKCVGTDNSIAVYRDDIV